MNTQNYTMVWNIENNVNGAKIIKMDDIKKATEVLGKVILVEKTEFEKKGKKTFSSDDNGVIDEIKNYYENIIETDDTKNILYETDDEYIVVYSESDAFKLGENNLDYVYDLIVTDSIISCPYCYFNVKLKDSFTTEFMKYYIFYDDNNFYVAEEDRTGDPIKLVEFDNKFTNFEDAKNRVKELIS